MYNGIGLKTARGSGTNGFVQRNLSYIRPSRILQFTQKHDQQIVEPKIKKQDDAILKHQVRRKIELELLELEDKMKEQGYLWIDYIEYRYTKEEIDTRIEAERKIRTSMMDSDVEKLRKMKEKQEEGEGEELHDYLGEEGKKIWMESGTKKRSRSRSRSRSHSRNHSRDRHRRSSSRSRSRSHRSHHHRHHH